MLGVICSSPEFGCCRAATIVEHLVFWATHCALQVYNV